MGIKDVLQQTGNLAHGILGTLSEITPETLKNEYGAYLMSDETVKIGYKLIRDVVIFTDRRIISIDKQGTTGLKARYKTIYLDSIIDIEVETAGFGIDDSEITLTYITSPYYKAKGGVNTDKVTYEFPKSYNIEPIYKFLQEIAYRNHKSINK